MTQLLLNIYEKSIQSSCSKWYNKHENQQQWCPKWNRESSNFNKLIDASKTKQKMINENTVCQRKGKRLTQS